MARNKDLSSLLSVIYFKLFFEIDFDLFFKIAIGYLVSKTFVLLDTVYRQIYSEW